MASSITVGMAPAKFGSADKHTSHASEPQSKLQWISDPAYTNRPTLLLATSTWSALIPPHSSRRGRLQPRIPFEGRRATDIIARLYCDFAASKTG